MDRMEVCYIYILKKLIVLNCRTKLIVLFRVDIDIY